MTTRLNLQAQIQLDQTGPDQFKATLIAPGQLLGHNLTVNSAALTRALPLFASAVQCQLNHTGWFERPAVEKLVGIWLDAHQNDTGAIVATLHLKQTPAGAIVRPILAEYLDDLRNNRPTLDIGVSLDCTAQVDEQSHELTNILSVTSADIVFRPASPDARFSLSQGPNMTTDPTAPAPPAPDSQAANQTTEYLIALAQATLTAKLRESELPEPMQQTIRTHFANAQPTPSEIDAAIAEQKTVLAQLMEHSAIAGHDRPRDARRLEVKTSMDMAQEITDWMFGAKDAKTPEPALRSPAQFYRMLTGDLEWHGVFDPTRAQFAGATTGALAGLAANAMNKVLIEQWDALPSYRWFERLVSVQPNDGTSYPMQWTTFGGISNLPPVEEKSPYLELDVDDAKETDSFTKYGGYVGITEEMFRRNDLAGMQAIPRKIAIAAIRTRSSNFATIFTTASGTGPTLDQDSTVLFHSNHSNIATTALSKTAWAAARLECFKHTELQSSKRMGFWPKFLIVPADLADAAWEMFGYGSGPGGYATGENSTVPNVNIYAASGPAGARPEVVVVPEWTDTNNWAYMVDPAEQPILMVSYLQNPGGRTHALPEIFSAAAPNAGLMFSNDVLPIKVRDFYAYGVANWRGIGKRNVA